MTYFIQPTSTWSQNYFSGQLQLEALPVASQLCFPAVTEDLQICSSVRHTPCFRPEQTDPPGQIDLIIMQGELKCWTCFRLIWQSRSENRSVACRGKKRAVVALPGCPGSAPLPPPCCSSAVPLSWSAVFKRYMHLKPDHIKPKLNRRF